MGMCDVAPVAADVVLSCRYAWTREEEGQTASYEVPSSWVLMFHLLILAKLPRSVQKSEAAAYVGELTGVRLQHFCVAF